MNKDDVLIGTCGTCKSSMSLARKDAKSGHGFWKDTPAGECPKCGAVVYLSDKPPTVEMRFDQQ